jgi:hypothetical protein
MYVDTLHLKSNRSLVEVANLIFPLFQLKNFEPKESSHYPTGRYFIARNKAFDLRISVEDAPGFEDYQYWLTFSYVDKAHRSQNDHLQILLENNLELCRARGDDRNPSREIYGLDSNKKITSKVEPIKKKSL